jgi:hypothetical protein
VRSAIDTPARVPVVPGSLMISKTLHIPKL